MTTPILLTLAGLLALTGATLLLWVVVAAFFDSPTRGLLALLVPGYAIVYGWRRMSHPRHRWIVSGAIGAFVAAAVIGFFSDSFAPEVTVAEGNLTPEDQAVFDGLDAPLNE